MNHTFNLRIYYQDTDAGGIVYHSKYLDFAERARSEMLIEMGVSSKQLINQKIAFVLHSAQIDYKSPARLDDIITIKTSVVEIKNASITMLHQFFTNDKLLVTITLKLAVINPDTITPTRLPDTIKSLFTHYHI